MVLYLTKLENIAINLRKEIVFPGKKSSNKLPLGISVPHKKRVVFFIF